MTFWIDNQINQSLLQFWWLGIVVAYLLTCVDIMLRDLERWVRLVLVACAGLVIVASIYLLDDLYTFYLSAVTLVVANLVAWHVETVQSPRRNRFTSMVLAMLVVSILLMPISITRVEVQFPNLSGGTWITFLSDNKQDELPPESNAVYLNILDYHWLFPITFGARIYPFQGQPEPRLRFDIERQNIVIRILSVRFKSNIGFADTTLYKISGQDLQQLIGMNEGAGYSMEMEGPALLLSNLDSGEPAMVRLPAPDTYQIPLDRTIPIVLLRLLLLAVIWFCSPAWLPRTGVARGNANKGASA